MEQLAAAYKDRQADRQKIFVKRRKKKKEKSEMFGHLRRSCFAQHYSGFAALKLDRLILGPNKL